ncbi:hypothetical protein AAFF_G00320160 [Aldrovandia affinis]|uniref:Uncharacterized protein n=1 Tax=Aldrovandia affinis TaxID=143900 RepID=A0AAD7W0G2_9TELE|nr:hypothetical protein AAFF_G00320160 [Aldrovandia affinis]
MAAPMPAASRLRSIPFLFVVVLFVSYCLTTANASKVYARQTLLDIGFSASTPVQHYHDWSPHGVLRQQLPRAIWATCPSCSRKKRARRRSRRAGVSVRLKRQTRDRLRSALHTLPTEAGCSVRLSCLRPVLPASSTHLPAFAR